MPLLVAAATDQTGRTITMLSVGLLCVAAGLTALTIWYWRFTSPRRREAAAVEPVEPPASPPTSRSTPLSPPPADHDPEPVAGTSGDGSSIGLDDEQWATLTQAVLDNYLDSPTRPE